MMIRSTLLRAAAAAALLAGLGAPALPGSALAAPPNSNKGGEVRGTTRADEQAGVHGDQGRDRAQANKAKQKTQKSTK